MNWSLLWQLVAAHAVCDYPLQGDFLARGKNHKAPIPGVPWYQCLVAHSLIHAAAVAVVTGNGVLGVCEFVCHFLIDYGKCEGRYDFNTDQVMHVVCKVIWSLIALGVLR